MPEAKSLAYFEHLKITDVKSFIALGQCPSLFVFKHKGIQVKTAI